jgi:hypothetical protein
MQKRIEGMWPWRFSRRPRRLSLLQGGDCHSILAKENDMTAASLPYRFFRNAMNALMAAREREAQSYVNGALLMLDDETLSRSGYSRQELQRRPARVSMI